MKKVNVPISCCKLGSIIAEQVYSKDGIKLVSKNTSVNSFIKEKLIEQGVNNVWVYELVNDELNRNDKDLTSKIKQNYELSIFILKSFINNITSEKKNDCAEMINVSSLLFEFINDNGYTVNCLNELRDADEYTYIHSVNVSIYSMLIAKWLGYGENEIKAVIQAGLLHDIGKIKISDSIINKNSKLSSEEYEEIKKHPFEGYMILKDYTCINESIKNAVLMHHERLDGTGYPFGIKADSIDFYAKIIAVADAFDAMTTDRIYKKRKSPFDAFKMFISTGISTFDRAIVKTFLDNISPYFTGARVLLNNGMEAEIVYIPPHDVTNPIIKIGAQYKDLSKETNIKVLYMV